MRVGGQNHVLAASPPRKGHGTNFTEGSVGPRASLNVCGEDKKILACLPVLVSTFQQRESLYTDWAGSAPRIIGEITEFISIKCKFIYQICQVLKIMHR